MKLIAIHHFTNNLGDHGVEAQQCIDIRPGETVEELADRIFRGGVNLIESATPWWESIEIKAVKP